MHIKSRTRRSRILCGCYCDKSENEVLDDLRRGSVPDEALVRSCCYKWICKVRGTTRFGLAESSSDYEEEAEKWRELCKKRKYLFNRQNPRGF